MLGWTVERTLHEDMNAILIGFQGRFELVQLQNGHNPYAPPEPAKLLPPKPTERIRRVPPPGKLQPLTPEHFDAMFPGKKFARPRRRARR